MKPRQLTVAVRWALMEIGMMYGIRLQRAEFMRKTGCLG